MRKLIALAIAFFFVFQSTAALSAPIEGCCMDDCKAAACALVACQACAAAVAPMANKVHVGSQPEALPIPGDEAAPRSLAQAIWRPPD